MMQYTGGNFKEINSTIEPDFIRKEVTVNSCTVTLQIWDLHGGEQFKKLLKFYYTKTQGFLVVLDISNRKTFEGMQYWLETIENTEFSEPVITVIVGNKKDKYEERTVSNEEAEEFAVQHKMHYFETSAKNNDGLDEIFTYLATQIFNNNNINDNQDRRQFYEKEEKRKSNCW